MANFRTKVVGAGAGAAILIAAPFIVLHEGTVLRSYPDPVEIWTACTGHTGPDVKPGQTYTEQQCLELLHKDLGIAQAAVRRNVRIPLPDKTEAAAISFVFNVGEGNLQRSTFLKRLNAGDIIGACNELPKWVYAKGKKLKGLVRRRQEERQLCIEGVSDTMKIKGRKT